MTKQQKLILGLVVGLIWLAASTVGGQYAGGHLFALLQKVPADQVDMFTLHDYWQAYSHVKRVKLALVGGIVVAAGIPALSVSMALYAALSNRQPKLYGDSKFANEPEVRKAGFFDESHPDGPDLLVGKFNGKFLRYWGKQFAALAAATQGGKGVGASIPNLLHYLHSVVVNDVKGELWTITAGWRAKIGHRCYKVSWTDRNFRSHCWNMLSYISRDCSRRMGDIIVLAGMIYPKTDPKNEFWQEGARNLFSGLVLYMLDTPGVPVNMANMLCLTTPATGEDLHTWIERTIKDRGNPANNVARLSTECVQCLRSFSVQNDKTRGDILSTFRAPLGIFRVPSVAASTSSDDFDLRDVRRKKMAIYLTMSARDLATYSLLVNIFFAQLIGENTTVEPHEDETLKFQCLLMMDEFLACGPIPILKSGISLMASYGLRIFMIYQNQGQIADPRDGYGPEGAETLVSNSTLKLMFAPTEERDAKAYSEALGTYTAKSISTSRQTSGKTSRSESNGEAPRPLMNPVELKQMGFGKVIVKPRECTPILAEKIIYWQDKYFQGRIRLPTPEVPRVEPHVLPAWLDMPPAPPTRALTLEELDSIDVNDIVNRQEIIDAMSLAIGIDLSQLQSGAAEALSEVA